MAYSTKYGISRFDDQKIRSHKFGLIMFAMAVVLAFLIHVLAPSQMEQLRIAAFPFFEEDVQIAFSQMAENMREGIAPGRAIKLFCEEILIGADY